MKTYNQLKAENERLRRALAPAANPQKTAQVEEGLKSVDLRRHVRTIRGKDHVAVTPKDLYQLLFGEVGSVRDITDLGRSLDALGWQRYAHNGVRYFVLPMGDYIDSRDW